MPAPNAAALIRANTADPGQARRPGHQVRRPGLEYTPSSTPTPRDASPGCSETVSPPASPRTSASSSTTPPTTCSRSVAPPWSAPPSSASTTPDVAAFYTDIVALAADDHRAAPRRAARPHRRPAAPGADRRRFADTDDPPRQLGADLQDALDTASDEDPGLVPTPAGVSSSPGDIRHAESGDLHPTPLPRHRHPDGDHDGPRRQGRRRLRLHAAVPLERPHGRLGAVARLRRLGGH